ncbi:hypothetical protein D3C81_528340 [compost metagenome]
MDFLDQPPVHIPTRFGFFQPSQLRISFHHRIDGLAHRGLIDLLDIDVQAFHGLDGDFALGYQLTLTQRLVGAPLTFHAVPGQARLGFFVTLLM